MREVTHPDVRPHLNDSMRSTAWDTTGRMCRTYMQWALRKGKLRSAWYWARAAWTAEKKAAQLREYGF